MCETCIKLVLHIQELVCFVLDGSPRLVHVLWKKHPDLAAHIENVILHLDTAPCHTTRDTLLEIVLGFKRAIHQPYSTDLAPLDFVYFPNLKLYLRGTRFNPSTNICHVIQQCNRSLYCAWFMKVYQKYRHYKYICTSGCIL